MDRRTFTLLLLVVPLLACEHGSPTKLVVGVGGDGLVTSDPSGISCPPTCEASFSAGSTIQLTAAPRSGSELIGFSGSCEGATCSIFAAAIGGRQQVSVTFSSCTGATSCVNDICGYFCTFPSCGDGIAEPGELCPGARTTSSVPPMASGLLVADVDHDGDNDLLTIEGGDFVYLLRNDGDAAFTLEAGVTTPGFYPSLIADVTGDGYPDLIGEEGPFQIGPVTVEVNDGTGHFLAPVVSATSFPGTSFATGDFDGDGDVDLAIAQGGHQSIIAFNDGHGVFSKPQTLSTPYDIVSLMAADVDGDSIPDVIASTRSVPLTPAGDATAGLIIWTSRSGFAPPQVVVQGLGAVALDVDGDGHLDLVTSLSNMIGSSANPDLVFIGPALAYAPNDGTGHFGALRVLYQLDQAHDGSSHALGGVALADLDGDGIPELLSTGLVFHGSGFAWSAAPIFPDLEGAALADLDGDGLVDGATIGGGVLTVELAGR